MPQTPAQIAFKSCQAAFEQLKRIDTRELGQKMRQCAYLKEREKELSTRLAELSAAIEEKNKYKKQNSSPDHYIDNELVACHREYDTKLASVDKVREEITDLSFLIDSARIKPRYEFIRWLFKCKPYIEKNQEAKRWCIQNNLTSFFNDYSVVIKIVEENDKFVLVLPEEFGMQNSSHELSFDAFVSAKSMCIDGLVKLNEEQRLAYTSDVVITDDDQWVVTVPKKTVNSLTHLSQLGD